MFMKTIAAASAVAMFATSAFAVTTLTVADALENGGTTIDILADDYTFDEDFASGEAGPLSFEFLNTGPAGVTIVISTATIRQTPLSFFTGGATVAWADAGVVASAAQGTQSGGSLTFNLAAGDTDTLVLDFGAATESMKGLQPNIDFTVSTVPVPAGALLMGTALAGFGVAARRKRKS